MAARTTLRVNLRITGVRETLRAFNRLPKDASDALREASLSIAGDLALRIAAAARARGAQAGLLASTVKARRDRVPSVEAGGTKRLGRNRTPAWRMLFGSEFGANGRYGWYARRRYQNSAGRQYPPHAGRDGYWFFPTTRDAEPEMDREWNEAADIIVRKFGGL